MTIEDEARALAPNLLRQAEAAASGFSLRTKIEAGVLLLIACAAGLWWLTRPAPPVPEVITAAPQVVQADHSVIAERAPAAQAQRPRTILPKGAVPERDVSVVVAPASGASSVQVDLQLVRMPDNGRRVIASSPDGQVVSALDIPIEAGLVPAPPKLWAAGLSYSTEREVGVWLERDLGRLRLGAEVAKGAGRPRAELRVGVAF
jgi:hypothetical protein